MDNKHTQQGAVSIFAVIFAALLLTVITIGFMKLMIGEQRRAIDSDLSQSAYDAALAGVEDAKRVVRACAEGKVEACQALEAANDCRVVARAGVAGDINDSETVIQTNAESGKEFSQAYTCVNIAMDTPDFLYEAVENRSQVIPLRAGSDFDAIRVEWFMQKDIGEENDPTAPPSGGLIPPKDSWGAYTPPLMRLQLITPGHNFQMTDLDSSATSQTAFLQPSSLSTSGGATNFDVDMSYGSRPRSTDPSGVYDNTTTPVVCSKAFANDAYACRATLSLGRTVAANDSVNALLRLNSVYRGANVRVSLQMGGTPVNFRGIQPSIDSTGRASSLFRRIEARLQIGDDFPYPNYAIDVAGGVCKNFSVDTVEAFSSGDCTP